MQNPYIKVCQTSDVLSNYHCPQTRTLEAKYMCTSLAAGFYLKDKESFDIWVQELKEMRQEKGDKFIFTVFEKEPEMPKELLDKLDDMVDGDYSD